MTPTITNVYKSKENNFACIWRGLQNQTSPSDRNIFLHPASDSYNQSGESSALTHSPICCPPDPHKQLLCSRQPADCQQNLPVTNRTLKGNSGGIFDLFREHPWYHGCVCVCVCLFFFFFTFNFSFSSISFLSCHLIGRFSSISSPPLFYCPLIPSITSSSPTILFFGCKTYSYSTPIKPLNYGDIINCLQTRLIALYGAKKQKTKKKLGLSHLAAIILQKKGRKTIKTSVQYGRLG